MKGRRSSSVMTLWKSTSGRERLPRIPSTSTHTSSSPSSSLLFSSWHSSERNGWKRGRCEVCMSSHSELRWILQYRSQDYKATTTILSFEGELTLLLMLCLFCSSDSERCKITAIHCTDWSWLAMQRCWLPANSYYVHHWAHYMTDHLVLHIQMWTPWNQDILFLCFAIIIPPLKSGHLSNQDPF